MDLMETSELAIQNAVWEIEKIGADVRLTKAVTLLSEAQDLVADFIDGIASPQAEGIEQLEKLYNEGMDLMLKLLPPDEYEGNEDAGRLWCIIKEMQDMIKMYDQKPHSEPKVHECDARDAS
jgi:hypothetical protein